MSVLPSTARLPARFTTSRATNFYYSFLFLPREKRRAIESVYAFARRGDDLADGDLPPDEAAREIARYREALDRCYAGRTDGHTLTLAVRLSDTGQALGPVLLTLGMEPRMQNCPICRR